MSSKSKTGNNLYERRSLEAHVRHSKQQSGVILFILEGN